MYKEIFKLQEEISELKKCLKQMHDRYQKTINSLHETNLLQIKHLKAHDHYIRDVSERLSDLEVFVHPNLAKDLIHVRTIIGDAAGDEALMLPLFGKPGEKKNQ